MVTVCRPTLKLVIKVLQQNPDDLDDGEDQRTKSQGASVVPEWEEEYVGNEGVK